MSKTIRISDTLYQQAKLVATAESRTISMQIEYWTRLGKCALDNPDLPIEFIKDTLSALNEPSEPCEFESK